MGISKENLWMVAVMLAGAGIIFISVGLHERATVGLGIALIVIAVVIAIFAQLRKTGNVHLSLEALDEIHAHTTDACFFLRNCDSNKFATNVRFDPVESRRGLKLWLDEVTSLAPGERVPLGFRAGDDGRYRGVPGHIISFFEGGSPITDQPPYQITARFLDGTQERTEQHTMKGTQLPKGGVRVKIAPTV